jgi:hypothetical protein
LLLLLRSDTSRSATRRSALRRARRMTAETAGLALAERLRLGDRSRRLNERRRALHADSWRRIGRTRCATSAQILRPHGNAAADALRARENARAHAEGGNSAARRSADQRRRNAGIDANAATAAK